MADGARELTEVVRRGGRNNLLRQSAIPITVVSLLGVTALGSVSEPAPSSSHGIETLSQTRYLASRWIRQGKRLRDLIDRGLLPSELRWQVRAAGALPYYTEWYTLDEFGLNDPNVTSWQAPNSSRRKAGHTRRASPAYTRARGIQVLPLGPELVREVPFAKIDHQRRRVQEELKRLRVPEHEALVYCFEVQSGSYLIFRSTVSPGEIESIFKGLRSCPKDG